MLMAQRLTKIAAVLMAIALPGISSAFTIYDEFGSFEDATWGGSGIPNDAVAASMQIVNGDDLLRVAMSATERYSNPAVGDNGEAIYSAEIGSNCGVDTDPVGCPSANQGALWNWNYFVDVTGGGVLGDYQIDIWYDLEAGAQRAFGDLSGLGRIDITASLYAQGLENLTMIEGSENNLFAWLGTDQLPFVDAPDTVFDPNAVGNYQYAITVTRTGFPVDTVAMEVNTVPVPASIWLLGSAIGLLGWIRRRMAR